MKQGESSNSQPGKYARYEFERKFLLKKIPENLPSEHSIILDRYFLGTNLRLRLIYGRAGELQRAKLTQKYIPEGGNPEKTIITNTYLQVNELDLLSKLEGAELRKSRFKTQMHGHSISVDVFQGELDGLILAEIEFPNEKEMSDFVTPTEWEDVSQNLEYTGGALAMKLAPTASKS